ncbi:MAG: RagB/SusD family nutrient uptake outer membrane protein [Maribacter dokdonensis]|uniref:RagB/SusD family nutrient uptake outer membrane protein n=2 Tax=Flavobacteriaceae TaxID=49546 RepID=UPI003265307B
MKKYIVSLLVLFVIFGCEDFLEEEVYTEFEPDAFLQDQSGIDALLTGAYGQLDLTDFGGGRDYTIILGEFPTDIAWETGGGLERSVIPIMGFNWDPTIEYFDGRYNELYSAIAAANNVLLVTSTVDGVNQEILSKAEAEARFIRGMGYYLLHNLFGPTPIIEIPDGATLDEIEVIGRETARATEEEYRKYVEEDLLFAADNLDFGGVSSRANRGSALALLTKFYLNNKQWLKAAESAEEVINEGGYDLYNDYTTLFSVDGEDNNEYIFRFECVVGSDQQNIYIPHAFPPNYPIQTNWENFGAQFRTYTSFYETFENNDIRKNLLLNEYVPTSTGVLTPLDRNEAGEALDDVRSFKYLPDPNAAGRFNGNDIPYVRLADIILARAEALNEINGPNQESIDLINIIRNRASATPIELNDFTSLENLRDFILAERGREFYTEGLRREDLIRHGKFIQQALDRGINAQEFQSLYPLPQPQIDNNPNLEQNPGY